MPKLKYESGGMSLEFEQRAGAELYINFNDFDDGGAKGIFEQYKIPGINGGITTTKQIDRRSVSFKFVHDTRCKNAAQTEQIINDIINPLVSGVLTYVSDKGEARHLNVYPQRSVLMAARYVNSVSYTAEFTADNPYWQGTEQERELSEITNVITNNGRHAIYPVLTFTSTGYISNTTNGEKLEVVREIAEKERLVYDCSSGAIQLLKLQNDTWIDTYNGELVFKNISNRLTLMPGKNGIVATAKGSIKYCEEYLNRG